MPARSVLVWIAIVAACGTLSCKRGSYYRPPPTSGVRFFALSTLSGDRSDTLLVSLSARNTGREAREIELPGCGDQLLLRIRAATRNRKTWSSLAWRQDSLARLRARGDTAPDGHTMIYGLCASPFLARTIAGGDSAFLAAITLPVRSILGDSLPPGRYRIEAQLVGYGARVGFLHAGEADLRKPGT